MMLAGHHFSATARPVSDLRVVQCPDDRCLIQRACLLYSRLPELQAPVQARAGAATREHGRPRIAGLVLIEKLRAEWIADALVVVEATVQAIDVLGRQQAQQVLVEVRADELPTSLREARVVQLLEERHE